ncbi:MAG: hypothetical protein AAF682_13100 [Planctomycetota bacterium]
MLELAARFLPMSALLGGALCSPAEARCAGQQLQLADGVDATREVGVALPDGLLVVGKPGEDVVLEPGTFGIELVSNDATVELQP